MPQSWTAAEVVTALREKFAPLDGVVHGTDGWAFLEQVACEDRIIDVLLWGMWRGSGKVPYERIAVEVKVSRGDFFRDHDAKREPWRRATHRFAYAVPEGLVTPGEVPDGCWLIEVRRDPCDPAVTGHRRCAPGTRVHWHPKVRGALNPAPELPEVVSRGLAREVSRRGVREHAGGNGQVDVAALLEEVTALRRARAADRQQIYELRARVEAAVRLTGPLAEQVCSACEAPLRPVVTRHGGARWEQRFLAAARADTGPSLPRT